MTVAVSVAIHSAGRWQCQTDRGAAVLAAAHERHCPMTPALADALDRLERSAIPALDAGWGRAFRLMGEAIGRPDKIGRSAFWGRGMAAFLPRVAEPVLRRAAQVAGHVPLAGPAALDDGSGQDLSQAVKGIEATVSQLLSTPEGMGRGFWIMAMLAVQGAAREAARPGISARSSTKAAGLLAEPDPVVGRLLFEVPPVFDEMATRRWQRRVRARSVRKRSGIRPKEGGVAGIRPSRQIDDLPDAVMSEFVVPEPVFANRLLNEGLLVRHRPPLREPKRDLLSVMLMDRRLDTSGLGGLVKAAWADAAIRLRIALGAVGRESSDLLFAEQTALRRTEAALRVDDGARLSLADPLALTPQDRAGLLLESRLLPDFVNSLPQAQAPSGSPFPDLLPAALRALAPLPAQPGERGRLLIPRPSDYAHRLTMFCLPAWTEEGRLAATDWSGFRAQRVAMTTRHYSSPTILAALLLPKRMGDDGFVAISDLPALQKAEIMPPAEGSDQLRLARTLGDLSGWLMDVTLGALDA